MGYCILVKLLKLLFTKLALYETFPASNYIIKVKNRNTKTRCEICSKLTIKTPERRQWRHFAVFIVNFEHISQLILVFLLLALRR